MIAKRGTLADAPSMTPLEVSGLEGGSEFKRHMCSMGILPGTTLELSNQRSAGMRIVIVGESRNRLALGKGVCSKILVKEN